MNIVRLSDTGNGSRVAVSMNTLAQYNAERARGIVHTPEWQTVMAELQAEFDARSKWQPVGDCGCAVMPNPPHGYGPSRFYCAEHTDWPDARPVIRRKRWWQR